MTKRVFPLSEKDLERIIEEFFGGKVFSEEDIPKLTKALQIAYKTTKKFYEKDLKPQEYEVFRDDLPCRLMRFNYDPERNVYVPANDQDWEKIVVTSYLECLGIQFKYAEHFKTFEKLLEKKKKKTRS